MSFEEKRAYRRFNIVLPVQYKFPAYQHVAIESSTLDISAGGLRMILKNKPLMEDEIHLALDLPNRKEVRLAATIVWAKPMQDGRYEVGVRLANTKSEDGKAFMDYYSQQLLNFIEANKDQGQNRIVQ